MTESGATKCDRQPEHGVDDGEVHLKVDETEAVEEEDDHDDDGEEEEEVEEIDSASEDSNNSVETKTSTKSSGHNNNNNNNTEPNNINNNHSRRLIEQFEKVCSRKVLTVEQERKRARFNARFSKFENLANKSQQSTTCAPTATTTTGVDKSGNVITTTSIYSSSSAADVSSTSKFFERLTTTTTTEDQHLKTEQNVHHVTSAVEFEPSERVDDVERQADLRRRQAFVDAKLSFEGGTT